MSEISRDYDINTTMNVFRRAVRVLLPLAQEVGMPVSDGEAYDEWDCIVESMFQGFVCEVHFNDSYNCCPLPRYGLSVPVYENDWVIEVRCDGGAGLFVFVSFVIQNSDVTRVRCAKVDPEMRVLDEALFDIDDCRFAIVRV